jgi:cytochrome c oxidase subunit 1
MFGRLMSPWLGRAHFWLTFVAYNLVFFPMHRLGLQGHMRRIYDPNQYEFLQHLQPLNTFISVAAFVLYAAQALFAVNFVMSWFTGARAGPNPWHDNGLEWTVPSPPPHGNFAVVPTVHRGAYEYSSPLVEEDYFPQSAPPVSNPPLRPSPAEPVPPLPREDR